MDYLVISITPNVHVFLSQERYKKHSPVAIGYCVRGLVLYDLVNKDTKIPIHKLSWKQIENIAFKVSQCKNCSTHNDYFLSAKTI